MKTFLTIFALLVVSVASMAKAGTHCARGGGRNVNLPFDAYYLYLDNASDDVLDVTIFERRINNKPGALVLEAQVEFVDFDQNRLRSTYASQDGRIQLIANEDEDGNIISAYVHGTGAGLNKKREFGFEGRSCGSDN